MTVLPVASIGDLIARVEAKIAEGKAEGYERDLLKVVRHYQKWCEVWRRSAKDAEDRWLREMQR